MILFPAIDLYEGKAVRLYKGDYDQMSVYDEDPLNVVKKFEAAGATHLHVVDLEGAKTGQTHNLPVIRQILENTSLFVEVGGGVRTMETIETYLSAGVGRVILGTAAVTDPDFLARAVAQYGEKIAVGVDLRGGKVAIKGWQETTPYTWEEFCANMEKAGVGTIICTDISKDGAMVGTNRALYRTLSEKFSMNIIASGGVSTLSDVKSLRAAGLYGCIIGKAYYTGAINLAKAIQVAQEGDL